MMKLYLMLFFTFNAFAMKGYRCDFLTEDGIKRKVTLHDSNLWYEDAEQGEIKISRSSACELRLSNISHNHFKPGNLLFKTDLIKNFNGGSSVLTFLFRPSTEKLYIFETDKNNNVLSTMSHQCQKRTRWWN